MQKVRDLIGRVAPTDSTVLICGEKRLRQGAGGRVIHAMSPRADKPFVAINCAAIPATLIEAELFGHERGSFTGAMRTREGVFERARAERCCSTRSPRCRWTCSHAAARAGDQAAYRVGGRATCEVDVRVLASTNRSPAQAFDEGRLREDIYYGWRWSPCSCRRCASAARTCWCSRTFSSPTQPAQWHAQAPVRRLRARFLRHRWPGNVRELRNAVERAYILCDGELTLSEQDMPTLRLRTRAQALPAT